MFTVLVIFNRGEETAKLQNGGMTDGMAEWQNGGMVEWWMEWSNGRNGGNGRMSERMAEWQDGRMAEMATFVPFMVHANSNLIYY